MVINKRRLLLCDTDAAYMEALTEYLISSCREYKITSFTSVGLFASDAGSYDVSLITEDFLKAAESGGAERLGRVMVLTDKPSESMEGYDTLFKFQSMESFVEALRSAPEAEARSDALRGYRQKMIGVYSPIRHELTLPFALAVSNILSADGRVLVVDLSELSMMPELVGATNGDLLDILYLLEHDKRERISEFVGYCEGFSYLPPMMSFGELSYITPQEWSRLFDAVSELGMDTIVILFDNMLQGFEGMLSSLDGLVLLNKSGSYYEAKQRLFMDFIKNRNYTFWMRDIKLPMSAANLADGTYSIGQLLRGNLGSAVRKEWERGNYVAAGQD